MTQTYEEILERMNSSFTELSGFNADSASDIGIRLKVLAGEIFSAYTNVDWLQKQMFPQTATGTQLELHAQQRGLARRAAEKSQGTLTFSRNRAVEYDIDIPVGTVCATPGIDGIRFVTTEAGVLVAGETSTAVPAQAETGGEKSNTSANTITVMITPPPGITLVTNDLPFIGGTDGESDDDLRDRLMESYQNISNGTNAAFYYDFVSEYDEIDSVSVVPREQGAGTVAIYVSSGGSAPSSSLIEQIQKDISNIKEINVDVSISAPEFVTVDVNATVVAKDGYDFSEVQTNCINSLAKYFSDLKIGDPYLLAGAGDALFHTEGVKNYKFSESVSSDIEMTQAQKAIAGTISITEGTGSI